VDLWTRVNEVHLIKAAPGDINWKFATLDTYTATSAYKAQFEGMVNYFHDGGGMEELGSSKVHTVLQNFPSNFFFVRL
jgi:hypothetical protein